MRRAIKIGCHEYEVQEVECVNKYETRNGEIDHIQRVIKIDKGLKDDDKREVLLHEIIHGLEEFMVLNLEEDDVTRLAKGLWMVLKDNPGLFR